MTTELVARAFAQAVASRRPAPGLIHHSGRGSQYCSYEYQAVLRRFEVRASMSRNGNCYDNARAEAEREISEYIDLFYNRERRQARLGYLSPAAYTQQFMRQQQAA